MPVAIGNQYSIRLVTDSTITSVGSYWHLQTGVNTYTFTVSMGGTKTGSQGDATLRAGGSWYCSAYNNSGFFQSAGNLSTAWPSSGTASESFSITFPGQNPPGGGNYFTLRVNATDTHDSGAIVYSSKIQYPPDSVAPTVTIVPVSIVLLNSSNQNVTKDDPAQFTVSAVDNSGGTGVKSITIDGTTYNTSSQSYSVTGGGLHTITASAEDYAGNITPNVTYDIFIDQTPPSVAIQSQNPITVSSRNYHGSSSVDIQIDTSDSDSGLDDGDLIINGTSSVFATTPAQTSYTTTIGSAQGVVEGLNTVEYVSKDVAGNQSTANVTFYVDTTSPDGYIVFSPQNKIRLNGGTYYTHLTNVDVDLHFGDSGSYPSGVSKGLIRINNTSTPSVSDFTSGIDLSSETSPKTSYNVTGLSVGQNNTLTFFVMDFAENISTGDTISVTVEQINPSGSIQISSLETPKITKSTTNYINDGTVELNLTHSDSESDLF